MSQIRQESEQIYSSLNLISLFAGEIQPFNANGSPYCTTALHMAFQFKSRHSNLNTQRRNMCVAKLRFVGTLMCSYSINHRNGARWKMWSVPSVDSAQCGV